MSDAKVVRPMRAQLTSIGALERLTSQAVDEWLDTQLGPGILMINAACGCADRVARPGVALAMRHGNRPKRFATVFAGLDHAATARVRARFAHIPPSSPSVALFMDGVAVDFLPRERIEGRTAQQVGDELMAMFDAHFGVAEPPQPARGVQLPP